VAALDLPGYSATVFHTNMFEIPDDLADILQLRKEIFDTPEEIFTAGWRASKTSTGNFWRRLQNLDRQLLEAPPKPQQTSFGGASKIFFQQHILRRPIPNRDQQGTAGTKKSVHFPVDQLGHLDRSWKGLAPDGVAIFDR
jgi:hypothetical protein